MDRKCLQRVVKTAEKITRTPLPSLQSIYHHRVHRRAASILKEPAHPQHGLFTLLPSGRRYISVKSKTTRLENSFFLTAIRLLQQVGIYSHVLYLITVPSLHFTHAQLHSQICTVYHYRCYCFFSFIMFCALQKCFTLYISVVFICFYIVGILQTAKEEFHFTETHVSIVHMTINTLNLELNLKGVHVWDMLVHLPTC